MIEFLRGRIVTVGEDAIVIDCGGLGLRARVRDGARFRHLEGKTETLPVWMAFRPRGADLFAFVDAAERAHFADLIAIPGVGATTALRLLPFHATLTAGPDATVPEIPGVGPAIRAKVTRWVRKRAIAATATKHAATDVRPLVAALRALGMPAAEAASRAESALANTPGAAVEDLIRLAVGRKG